MKQSAISHLLAGLLIVAVSWPLIRRKIGMNRWYGIRLKAAFESEEKWYQLNEYGGRLFLRWGILVMLVGLTGLVLPPRLEFVYIWASLAVIIGSLVVVMLDLRRYTRRLQETKDSP
jgi:hypothetical protein